MKTKPHRILGTFARFLGKSLLAFILLSILLTALFRCMPVYCTPLMLIRAIEQLAAGKKPQIRHRWVTMEKISPHLALAVLCSEDQNFTRHFGFDFKAIEQSLEAFRQGKKLRGASTISQQTAKNVFLWPHRSWIRKGLEVYFTILIEMLWSKQRILEVYLNSIEMGSGVYGAEAAAQIYFKKNARDLTRTQAAALAAVLPNPRRYVANPPGPYVKSRIRWIVGQMNRWGDFRGL